MTTQPTLPFDITAKKHKGNKRSRAANLIARPHKKTIRERALEIIRLAHNGATVKEIASIMQRPMHSVSGRVSELSAEKKIVRSGEVRDAGDVWMLAEAKQ